MTNLTTPAEIDTKLADLYWEQGKQHNVIDAIAKRLERDAQAPSYSKLRVDQVADFQAQRDEARALLAAAVAEAAPLERKYSERRWTRYYLVQASNGHVHSSTHCSTCFTTTVFHWLAGQSGLSEVELVELAGEEACTVCFPSAPVDVLKRKSQLTTPEREAAAAARAERKAKSDALAAKRVANAITNPDGSRLELDRWDRVDTLSAAWGRATDRRVSIATAGGWEREGWIEEMRDHLEILTLALMHKLEQDRATVEAEILRRSQSRAKREGYGARADWDRK